MDFRHTPLQHDANVAGFMSALSVYDRKAPGYASAFIIEQYSDKSVSKI